MLWEDVDRPPIQLHVDSESHYRPLREAAYGGAEPSWATSTAWVPCTAGLALRPGRVGVGGG